MRINIKVHARSKRESVTALPDGSYKVEVKAPPVEGAANEAICELLADYFKVHKRDVRVVLGSTNNKKVVEIDKYSSSFPGRKRTYRSVAVMAISPARVGYRRATASRMFPTV